MTNKLYILSFLLIQIIGGSCIAQNTSYPYDIQKYSFVDNNKNVLSFSQDSSGFEDIYKRFDDLIFKGEGKISILQIGGSHIQADIYSNQIRQRLQTFYPGLNGGRGFVFPYRMAKTNNPYNYKVEYTGEWESCRNIKKGEKYTLGLAGISVTTHDSISSLKICTRENNLVDYDYKRVKIFTEIDTLAFSIVFDPSLIEKIDTNINLGYIQYTFTDYIDTLDFKIIKQDTNQKYFTLYGLNLETDDPGIVYNSVGVNGASVPAFLRCNILSKHIEAIQPDIVILSLGINDAYGRNFDPNYFKANYDSLVRNIRAGAPNCEILFTTNNDSYLYRRYPNKNGIKVKEAMFELAEKYNGCVWDMFTVMGGLNSIRYWEQLNLAKRDKVHFTKEGYILVGNLFFNAFIKSPMNIH
jgi:lysophospholipase L1-like esterase